MLFDTFSTRSLHLANHMVMAPMTRSRATPEHIAEHHRLDLRIVNEAMDPTFAFMPPGWEGQRFQGLCTSEDQLSRG